MPVDLSVTPTDKGTIVIVATFKDEENTTVTVGNINSIQWSLYNESGVIVNSREDVSPVVANPLTIALTNNDLAYSAGRKRRLLIEVDYDSTNGNNLDLREVVNFNIADLMGV